MGLLRATLRSGCFSLMNDYQRSAGWNLNIGTCKGCEICFQFLQNVFPRKRVCYKYKHSTEYRLGKTHRNFANFIEDFKRLKVFCTNKKCLKLTRHVLCIVVIGSVTLGSKVKFPGSRPAFTLRFRRLRF